MVDLPRAIGISFRNFFKSYKSFFKKWRSKISKSCKKDSEIDQQFQSDAINGTPKDHEEGKQERTSTMNGIQSFRYGGSMRENDPAGFRPRSYDGGGFAPPSRNSSRRSMNSPLSSSLFRSMSRRSPEQPSRAGSRRRSPEPPSRAGSRRRSTDSVSSSPSFLSKNGSRRSATPIMFSNSSGVLKHAAIEKQLECTLEELCFGCTKNIKITRDVVSYTGQTSEEEEMLTIKVKPGWKKGTKITFEGMGNERPGTYPADITFVISEKRHPFFIRKGDDIELTVEISLLKALTGSTISVPLLGGESLSLSIDDVVSPGYEKLIEGQGMPNPKDNGKRGYLKIKFLVDFPTDLTDQQRSEVCRILEGSI